MEQAPDILHLTFLKKTKIIRGHFDSIFVLYIEYNMQT
jgi:hypothetical protein